MKKVLKALRSLYLHLYAPLLAGAIAGVSVTEYDIWRSKLTDKEIKNEIRLQEYKQLEDSFNDYNEAYGNFEDYINNFEDNYQNITTYSPYIEYIKTSCGVLYSLKISELNKNICHTKNNSMFKDLNNLTEQYKQYTISQTPENLTKVNYEKENLKKSIQDYNKFYSNFYENIMHEYDDLK